MAVRKGLMTRKQHSSTLRGGQSYHKLLDSLILSVRRSAKQEEECAAVWLRGVDEQNVS